MHSATPRRAVMALATLMITIHPAARADVVTDWNLRAGEVIADARIPAQPANRVSALVQSAVYEAVNAITGRYPPTAGAPVATGGASLDAAVAAANRAVLKATLPAQQAGIDKAFDAAMAKSAAGAAERDAGIALGEKAAAFVLAKRAEDTAAATGGESYRPHAAPGAWVPTALPAAPQWPSRKPWLLASADQIRPGPPPALNSITWTRDYNEIKEMGARASKRRSQEQTDVAKFWEYTLPPIYHGVVQSVANQPGRDPSQNARLFMAVTQATDDALIAIMDAKLHYNFWRPVTAIRNGDTDGNDATARDPNWLPFIDTPMHPEYPCAHCTLAGAVGAVVEAELGAGPVPPLTSSSPTAKGASRTWNSVAAFVQEVAEARILDGVHYRNSTEVGTAMGRRVGEMAARKYLSK